MTSRRAKPEPLFATAATAARLLEMTLDQFNELVAAGYLPRPHRIGTLERFDVAQLQSAIRGDLIGGGEMEW